MDSIKVGDKVSVRHCTEDYQEHPFIGIVKHIPADVGDSWEIHGDTVREYQKFGFIEKLAAKHDINSGK